MKRGNGLPVVFILFGILVLTVTLAPSVLAQSPGQTTQDVQKSPTEGQAVAPVQPADQPPGRPQAPPQAPVPAQTQAPAPAQSQPPASAQTPAPEQVQPPPAKPAVPGQAPLKEPKSLSEAIEQGVSKGFIDKNAKQGYLGIPGAPSPNWILAFLWAVWVGWIFSTVGAFGGIMAGVGHLTVYGLGDYAKTFKKTSPFLNKLLTDSIRVSNQYLVGLSAAISSVNYYRLGRIVLPLGIALGLGSIFGATVIPWATAGKIQLSQYQGYFGLVVLVVGAFLLYETTPRGQNRKKEARAAAQAFEKSIKEKKSKKEIAAGAVQVSSYSFSRVTFSFFGVEFSFNPIFPFLGGIFIAAISSFIGVGGGFLYVPFLTSVTGLPMHIVAGTSALTVFISMITSIINYMATGALVSWALVGVELIGIFVGSMIGPRTSKYIPDRWLKVLFVILAIYVGLRYVSKGFFGTSWVPPY